MSPAWTKRYKIATVVEGDGEVLAVPELIRQWFNFRNFWNFRTLDPPIRAPGAAGLTCPHVAGGDLGIEHFVNIALKRDPDAILVLLDADDECIKRHGLPSEQQLGPELLERARRVASHVPLAVVVANREFEAWLLAGHRRLRRAGILPASSRLAPGFDVEGPRDCKGRVGDLLGRRYSPTADQKVLAAGLTFKPYMRRHSPSFDKLVRDLEFLAQSARRRSS
ncbi:MAG TPA: DUF4276 family protein [Pirellulales bacterium]|nr:DUF4276 family protein [Pirellulales bacterium]